MPKVLVIHPDGQFLTKRSRVLPLIDSDRAYWRDANHTVAVMVTEEDSAEEHRAIEGYDYGGRQSYDGTAVVKHCDLQTRTVVSVPRFERDRTGILLRAAGGAKVMQLGPMRNRRTTGSHSPNHDRLWRPDRKNPEFKDLPKPSLN